MSNTFIRNHQYNLIKKQVSLLQNAYNTANNQKVIQSVREQAQVTVLETCPVTNEQQLQSLNAISTINSTTEFQSYLNSLEPYVEEFPKLTDIQLKKLFPKIKKLKTPNWAELDYRYVTYLGWTDIATNKMFLIYRLDNQIVGIEGRFTPTHKKGVCFLCNKHEKVALFTSVIKAKPAKASPDYYKAMGNYMCVNSNTCNHNITNVTVLDKFFRDVLGKL
ncbi:MAG: FusB/FusC family EF-G-binding protein [Candidatus Pristimantibacillus lignocellulolyticus]|uniref:FusB/FusC family EF-G-binding protein n=1 Tax=Candidatus Pristimantibacillus lignocellulolyticus TaxID=2994561 RepID=A0A9J6ZHK0_9BACL|nr:MAG: FusB/FusC family EF-G-binding protein [Candidatus Pristimantibacillus lignocellulolyticus]